MEILSRGGLKLMKDGHIQNIKNNIVYIYLHLQPFNFKARNTIFKKPQLKTRWISLWLPSGWESCPTTPLPLPWVEQVQSSPAEMTSPTCLTSCTRSVRCCGVQLPCQSRCQHLPHCRTLRWKIPGELNRNWIFSIRDFWRTQICIFSLFPWSF